MRDCLVFAPTQLPLESLGQNSSSLPFIGPGSVFPEQGEKRGGAVFLEVFETIYLDGSLPLGIVCIWSSRLSPLYLGATLHPLGSYSALVH